MAKDGPWAKTELELKLVGAPRDVAAVKASRVIANYAESQPGPPRRLVSTYYDTGDGSLRKAGIALRLREGAGERLQTIKRSKGDSAISRREEEQRLQPGDAFPRPTGMRKAAKIIAEAKGLAPVSRILSDRTIVNLEVGKTRIEAAIDLGRVEAWRKGAPWRSAPLAEAELELIEGDPAALFDVAAKLIEESGGRLRPGALTKAEQAQRLCRRSAEIVAESPVRLDADADAGEALAATLRSIGARVIDVAPAIIDMRLPEGVHQMRIALRRLRSVERIYRPALASKSLRALARRARDFADALGPARDWDVFLEDTLTPLARAARDEPGGEEGFAALAAHAGALRAEAWERAASVIGSADFGRFSLDLLEAGHLEGWRRKAKKGLKSSARDFAAHALDGLLEDAREAARAIDSDDPAARHPLRIALKKLRYAAQTFRSLYKGDARKTYMAALSRLQEDLGAVNDAVTAQRLANEAAMGQGKLAAHAAGFICGFHAAAAEVKAAAVGEDWRAFAAAEPFWREAEDHPDAEDSGHSLS